MVAFVSVALETGEAKRCSVLHWLLVKSLLESFISVFLSVGMPVLFGTSGVLLFSETKMGCVLVPGISDVISREPPAFLLFGGSAPPWTHPALP